MGPGVQFHFSSAGMPGGGGRAGTTLIVLSGWGRSERGRAILAESLMNRLYHPVIPKNPRTSVTDVGGSNAVMASTFFGVGLMPSPDTMCPRSSISASANWHFDSFSVMPPSLNLCITSTSLTVLLMLLWEILRHIIGPKKIR